MRKTLIFAAVITLLAGAAAFAAVCPSCGFENKPDAVFCAKCGANLSTGQAPQPAQPVLKGPKKTVAVSSFENRSGFVGEFALGDGMADQLTDALVQSGQFIVLTRQDLGDVLQEQDLAATGRTAKSNTARIGKVISAQILIKGTVTEFAAQSSGGSQGLTIKGITLGGASSEAHVGLIISLNDTTTGEVIESQRVEGKAKSGGLKFGYSSGDFGFGTSGFKNTPLGKATQITIDNAVAYIATKMANIPWEGKVVTVKDEEIIINAGENTGIHVSDIFTVYKEGEPMIDPDTGINLGSESEKIGKVQVTSVQERFSKAKALDGSGFARGDLVKVD